MTVDPVRGRIDYATATIASAAALSDEVFCGNRVIVGMMMPAAWTAAAISFDMSDVSGGTFVPAYDAAGAEISLTVAASTYVAIDPMLYHGMNYIKVRSGLVAATVNQDAERELTLVLGERD